VIWRIENREQIRFWYDVWRGGESLLGKYPRLFSNSLNKDAIIGELVSWNFDR